MNNLEFFLNIERPTGPFHPRTYSLKSVCLECISNLTRKPLFVTTVQFSYRPWYMHTAYLHILYFYLGKYRFRADGHYLIHIHALCLSFYSDNHLSAYFLAVLEVVILHKSYIFSLTRNMILPPMFLSSLQAPITTAAGKNL